MFSLNVYVYTYTYIYIYIWFVINTDCSIIKCVYRISFAERDILRPGAARPTSTLTQPHWIAYSRCCLYDVEPIQYMSWNLYHMPWNLYHMAWNLYNACHGTYTMTWNLYHIENAYRCCRSEDGAAPKLRPSFEPCSCICMSAGSTGPRSDTPNPPTDIVGFRGLDSSIMLILRGGIPRPIGDWPESLSRAMLVGTMLVGRLGIQASVKEMFLRRRIRVGPSLYTKHEIRGWLAV